MHISNIPIYLLEMVNYFFEGNWHKYSIGELQSYEDAKQYLITSDVHNAFMIAYSYCSKDQITVAKNMTNETDFKSPVTRGDI